MIFWWDSVAPALKIIQRPQMQLIKILSNTFKERDYNGWKLIRELIREWLLKQEFWTQGDFAPGGRLEMLEDPGKWSKPNVCFVASIFESFHNKIGKLKVNVLEIKFPLMWFPTVSHFTPKYCCWNCVVNKYKSGSVGFLKHIFLIIKLTHRSL